MFFPQRQVSLNIALMTARNYVQQDRLTTPNSLHAVFTFIMPVLLNFLELMYQGKDYSPFDTHPINMWIGLTCLLAYCLAYGVEVACSKCFRSPVFASIFLEKLLYTQVDKTRKWIEGRLLRASDLQDWHVRQTSVRVEFLLGSKK
ncbi:hypothetical protein H0E87_027324 [Populus deltoides]|uniref:Uncharacterized protein n=1 Tax=Populus deltoides TaxID=3696 RepID=A0A8T2WX48_POPDE|nr:hypothetical protein H0E87_027324 [Populus deltoides]